jgi:hypothetical protein
MLVVGAVLALELVAPSVAAADTITVTTNLDTSVDHCTLRDAIVAANTAATTGACVYADGGNVADPDTINFNLPTLPATINLGTPLPQVLYPLSIVGPGASQLTVTRSSGSNFRILLINPNGLNDTDVVSGLTLSNGNLGVGVGAGIDTRDADLTLDHVIITGNHAGVNSLGGASGQGGGIFNNNDGTLHLIGSTVSDNHVAVIAPGGMGGLAEGGGIDNEGTMTVIDSTISGNDATETASGGNLAVADGGGIVSNAATIKRSTISGNAVTSTSATGPSSTGGAGLDSLGSSLDLELSTVAGNTATSATTSGTTDAEGGGIYVNTSGATLTGDTIAFNTGALSANFASATPPPSTTSVRDTIVSNPTGGPNCSLPATGTITSLGFNVEDDATGSCQFEASHDLPLATDPLLNPTLAGNGGPTENYALQTGSPAIEAGSAFGETTDQRGLLRPSDDLAVATAPGSDGADIGAFEVQGQPFAAPSSPPGATPTPTAPARKKCKRKKHGHKASAAKKCKKKKRK